LSISRIAEAIDDLKYSDLMFDT